MADRTLDEAAWRQPTNAVHPADRTAVSAGRARMRPGQPGRAQHARLPRCRCSLIFGVFSWFPIVRALVMSVQETNLVSEPTFVGLDNFARVLADPLFGTAVGNTAWFALLALVFGFPIPIVLAVIMSEVRRDRGLYSALAYLPVVVPPVVVGAALAVLLRRQPDTASSTRSSAGSGSARCRGSRTRAARCRRSSSRRPGRRPARP